MSSNFDELGYDANFSKDYGLREIVGRVKRIRDQMNSKIQNIDRFLEQYVTETTVEKSVPVYFKGKDTGEVKKVSETQYSIKAGSLPMGDHDFTSRVEWLMNDVEWLTSNLGFAALARELALFNFGAQVQWHRIREVNRQVEAARKAVKEGKN